MNTETDSTESKRYQMFRWRSTPPGGYYGGVFAGFGLAMLAGGFIPSSWDKGYIGIGGAAIILINTLVTYFMEALRDEDHGRKAG